jgi:polyhydroxyalkanoate synthase
VAGVVNPPHKNKYGYTVNDKNHDGSWWIHWQKWIKNHNKNKMIDTKNRKTHKNYKKISAAPGEYVLKKA